MTCPYSDPDYAAPASRRRAGLAERALDLVRDGYPFAAGLRARATDPDPHHVAALKLLGRRAVLVRGRDAVRFFYDTDVVKRDGAMPTVVSGPLFGRNPVHRLDDAEHRHRKSLFIDTVRPGAVHSLAEAVAEGWREVLAPGSEVTVYDAATTVFGTSVLEWAGVSDLDRTSARTLSRELAAIVDGFGVPGLPWLKAVALRRKTGRWAEQTIQAVRNGERNPPDGSALRNAAEHRDLNGDLLDAHTAGVELHNIVRPTIAVSRFAAFTALALIDHPDWVRRLRDESDARGTTVAGPQARAFAQEVRRYFPFVPMLPAVARGDTEFHGCPVSGGQRVLIDILNTNRDPELWEDADEFRPERFVEDPDLEHADYFIPQGGGEADTGHRCPGEPIAVELLTVTAAELAAREWSVPEQDLSYPVDRMPTAPRDGVRLRMAA